MNNKIATSNDNTSIASDTSEEYLSPSQAAWTRKTSVQPVKDELIVPEVDKFLIR